MPREDSGILREVPGELIHDALSSLPPAETSGKAKLQYVEVHAKNLGLVRIRLALRRRMHGSVVCWFWVAEHAEKV